MAQAALTNPPAIDLTETRVRLVGVDDPLQMRAAIARPHQNRMPATQGAEIGHQGAISFAASTKSNRRCGPKVLAKVSALAASSV